MGWRTAAIEPFLLQYRALLSPLTITSSRLLLLHCLLLSPTTASIRCIRNRSNSVTRTSDHAPLLRLAPKPKASIPSPSSNSPMMRYILSIAFFFYFADSFLSGLRQTRRHSSLPFVRLDHSLVSSLLPPPLVKRNDPSLVTFLFRGEAHTPPYYKE